MSEAAHPVLAGLQAWPVWDAEALDRVLGVHAHARGRLYQRYLATSADIAATMQTLFAQRQWRQIAELAHKLKSSSRSVGAMRLGALCEALELHCKGEVTELGPLLVAQLQQEFQQVHTLLREVGGVGPA